MYCGTDVDKKNNEQRLGSYNQSFFASLKMLKYMAKRIETNGRRKKVTVSDNYCLRSSVPRVLAADVKGRGFNSLANHEHNFRY